MVAQDGKEFGDEYLAELDYIENVEKNKEGYESDVSDVTDDDKSRHSSDTSDSDLVPRSGDRLVVREY